jgi:hypothetical protein
MKLQALSLTLALVVTSSALKVPLKQSLDLKNGGTSFSVLRPGGALSKNVLATASGSGGTALNLTCVNILHQHLFFG